MAQASIKRVLVTCCGNKFNDQTVDRFIEHFSLMHFDPGQRIATEGSAFPYFCVILKGKLQAAIMLLIAPGRSCRACLYGFVDTAMRVINAETKAAAVCIAETPSAGRVSVEQHRRGLMGEMGDGKWFGDFNHRNAMASVTALDRCVIAILSQVNSPLTLATVCSLAYSCCDCVLISLL